MRFTPDQTRVIELHQRNLLVSAAAGSGKTAVLVERIIRMLTREQSPIDIDRLLVVTFTKAAASEMRERISRALDDRLRLTPDNEHLQKQEALLHHAKITTIDSFCQSVLRNHFNEVGLDPAFRVADTNELRLIREDILSELFEEHFSTGSEDFIRFVDSYQGKGRENRIENVIMKLHEYSLSYPWPEEWLESCTRHYQVADAAQLEQEEWIHELIGYTQERLTEAKRMAGQALELCHRPGGPLPYEAALVEDLNWLEQMSALESYERLQKAFALRERAKLGAVRGSSFDQELKEQTKVLRERELKVIEKLQKDYYQVSARGLCEVLQACEPAVSTLVSLIREFEDRLQEKKKELNVVDFSDIEHLALKILIQRQGASYTATQAARDYRDCFDEIMIDEYQDSNSVQELLLQSISGEAEGRNNRFMVGDVKQSIYRFRLARPEIFLEKYRTYSSTESDCQKIDLHQNFRSRKEVLGSVNQIFARVMRPEVGHIVYDDMAALYPGAEYPESDGRNQTELLLMTEQGEESKALTGTQRIELEARMIAMKIRELIGSFPVTERKKAEDGTEELMLRPAAYRDVVILLRSISGWADVFRKVFEEEGIPVYVASKTGYFSAIEIQTILNYLMILDNPLQDIPLYGVLTSAFGEFTEEEIVLLRQNQRDYLFEDLKAEDGSTFTPQGREKLAHFLADYERFRKCMLYTPIHELLRMLIRDTGYGEAMEAMPGGNKKKANLEMLVEKAVAYEQTSFHGLFHFMRYLDNLKKYQVDEGEADVVDEASDLVRIMTIHGSKGLEFPICFVAGLAKSFNTMDEKHSVSRSLELGIGIDYVNPEERTRTRNLLKNIMNLREHSENLGEELRVLYVAMTRAKEKLYLTGAVKEYESYCQEIRDQIGEGEVPVSYIRDAGCMLDWIMGAVLAGNGDELPMVSVCTAEQLEQGAAAVEITEALRRKALEESTPPENCEQAMAEELEKRFRFVYPYEALRDLYTKTTVSELKIAALEEAGMENETADTIFPENHVKEYIPRFRREQEAARGTDRGTAYHKALELMDFELPKSEEALFSYLQKKEQTGELPAGFLPLLNMKKLLAFMESSVAGRMGAAHADGRLYREQPFVLGLPANQLHKEFPASETVLIQGIIDVYFEEPDGLVVLDYKTDRVSAVQELTERYHTQLDYYAQALERLTGKRVKEKLIYSFALGCEVTLL